MKQTRNALIFIFVALILFIFIFILFLYTLLHEVGHAIIGLLYGQSLTEFNVSFWNFSAHMGMVGGELTQSQLAIQSAAGVSLPLLIWTIFMIIVPRKTSIILESLKFLSSMTVLNTLLAWIILPVLFLLGKAPSDDVTNFLRYSQIPPLLLVIVATTLYAVGWILFSSKIDGIRNEFLLFRTMDREKLTSGLRTAIPVMASLMTFCVFLAFTFHGFAEQNSVNTFSPPPDFAPITEIDLSARAYLSETLAQFTLDEPTYISVFITIRSIDTTYFDLGITGPDGYSSIILHAEGYSAVQGGRLWEENLLAGTYQLVLTSHRSQGNASVYLKTR